MRSSYPCAPGGQNFVLVASLIGAVGGGRWLRMVLLILPAPERSALDFGVGILALALLCLLELSLEAWGPGGRCARLLFAFAVALGAASVVVL